jgi:hypothetical protein
VSKGNLVTFSPMVKQLTFFPRAIQFEEVA